jgi:hypothetical protein
VFKVKDAALDQYPEGKYEGEFVIKNIFSASYSIPGGLMIETRAQLGGMTLSDINQLSKDDAHQISPQEVDPIDEERVTAQPAAAAPAPVAPSASQTAASPNTNPLDDDTPFVVKPAKATKPARQDSAQDDATLFGELWPLAAVVKLDATLDRRRLRQQISRLNPLGYEFDPRSQEWHRKAA